MTVAVLLFVLGVGSLLASFLLRRTADRLARGRQQKAGTAFDADPVRSRICALRKDFVAELQSRERDGAYQRALMNSAREAVVKLAFFRTRAGMEPHAEEHTHTA